jgi:hypothetical protein
MKHVAPNDFKTVELSYRIYDLRVILDHSLCLEKHRPAGVLRRCQLVERRQQERADTG